MQINYIRTDKLIKDNYDFNDKIYKMYIVKRQNDFFGCK